MLYCMESKQRIPTLGDYMERFKDFSRYELKLLAAAIWTKQRHFVAGDRRFKEYGALLDEIRKRIYYSPGTFI